VSDEQRERWQAVHAMRGAIDPKTGKRFTMKAIGEAFDPPLTKQRVKQIVDQTEPPAPVGRPPKE
jgi:hypothetical protein